MKTSKYLFALSLASLLLSGCSINFNDLGLKFRKAAKQTKEMIIVSDEKKQSLQDTTKNMYVAEFELESQKPYEYSQTYVVDISAATSNQYLEVFTSGSAAYEMNNGHSNITQKGYYSEADKFVKYQKDEDTYDIQESNGSYVVTKNGQSHDISAEADRNDIDKKFKLWKTQFEYCFSYELNSLANFKARLSGSTADENSTMDFLSKIELKEYRDSGNYVAVYKGEAHKNDGSNDVMIDYIELKYSDYRLQYSLVHTVSVNYASMIETHKLTYNKMLYNVKLADCFPA